MRSTTPAAYAFVVSLWTALAATLLMAVGEPGSLLAVGAAVLLTLTVAAAHPARMRLLPSLAHTGPPVSAQRRRRGSFLRQSNPDTAGRARPRAPGHVG